MDELPAVLALAFMASRSPTKGSVAGLADPAQLLDVDVDQLAWSGALVSTSGLQADPPETTQTRTSEDARHRGLGHPERLGDLRTGEAQSPQGADCTDTLLGFRAVGTLTSAAAAAEVSDQSSFTTRFARRLRCFRLSAALPCSFIRILLGAWVASTPSLQGGRMNNVVRNYN